MIQDALNNYLYDAKGRLCAVENILAGTTTEYVYDADSRRVAKGSWAVTGWPAAGATWTGTIPSCATPTAANGFTLTALYLRGGAGDQDVEIDPAQGSNPSGWHQNVFANGGLLATYTQSGTAAPALYFNFNDWLGTKRLEVNAAGQAVNYWGSDPFGDYLTPHVSTPDPSEHHFTGKERDSESGNDYFKARYYGSNTGRFLSPDPIGVMKQKIRDPQQWDMYSYGKDNPLHFADPSGKFVTLVGNDVQRKKELDALKGAVGKKAGAYLYDNLDKATGKHSVGILSGGPDGKSASFNSLNSVANKVGDIIQATDRGVNIQMASPGSVVDGELMGALPMGAPSTSSGFNFQTQTVTITLSDGPAGTLPGSLSSDGQPLHSTPADLLSHELGHADSTLFHGAEDSNGDAVRTENGTRKMEGEPTREGHKQPGDVQVNGTPF